MRLLLMRHGIASPLDDKIRSDAERPLTPEGRDKTQEVARGLLAFGEEFDLMATSPLKRALQTAEIVRQVYADSKMKTRLEIWPELEHAQPAALVERLQELEGAETVLLIGHEPGLSRFASQLLTASPDGLSLEFKKAGVCALEIQTLVHEQSATLLWHLTPRQLRLIGKQ